MKNRLQFWFKDIMYRLTKSDKYAYGKDFFIVCEEKNKNTFKLNKLDLTKWEECVEEEGLRAYNKEDYIWIEWNGKDCFLKRKQCLEEKI